MWWPSRTTSCDVAAHTTSWGKITCKCNGCIEACRHAHRCSRRQRAGCQRTLWCIVFGQMSFGRMWWALLAILFVNFTMVCSLPPSNFDLTCLLSFHAMCIRFTHTLDRVIPANWWHSQAELPSYPLSPSFISISYFFFVVVIVIYIYLISSGKQHTTGENCWRTSQDRKDVTLCSLIFGTISILPSWSMWR